jgi:hypothetical protein
MPSLGPSHAVIISNAISMVEINGPVCKTSNLVEIKYIAFQMHNFFLLALQPTVGFSLVSDILPFCSFFTLLSPAQYTL